MRREAGGARPRPGPERRWGARRAGHAPRAGCLRPMLTWGCGEVSRTEASGTWYVVGPGWSRSIRIGGRRSSPGRKQALGLGPPSSPTPAPPPQAGLAPALTQLLPVPGAGPPRLPEGAHVLPAAPWDLLHRWGPHLPAGAGAGAPPSSLGPARGQPPSTQSRRPAPAAAPPHPQPSPSELPDGQ